MRRIGKRTALMLGLGVLAVPLVGTALAYGCTAIATLQTSSAEGTPGSVVTVTGKGFGTHDAQDERSNRPAEIRMGSLTAPVLATTSPTGDNGTFTAQFTVPADAPAGETFIAVTQERADGRTVYGTPARQAFTVSAAPAAPAPATPTAPPVVSPDAGDRGDRGAGDGQAQRRQAARRRAQRKRAVAVCKRKFSARNATRKVGKRRMAKRRSACIKRARTSFS